MPLTYAADFMEYPTASSGFQDNDHEDSSLLIPSFNFTLPSRPNSPSHLIDISYFESADLLGEIFTQQQSPHDSAKPFSRAQGNVEILEETDRSFCDIEALEQQLRDSFCQNAHKESRGFLPLDKLNELVIEASVAAVIAESMPQLSIDAAHQYARAICPVSLREPLQTSFRKVFAILILVQQPREILTFIENNINDLDLPLIKVRSETRGRYELRRKSQRHKPLTCLKGWSQFLVDSFEGYQWSLISPFFSRGSGKHVCFYLFDDQTILPFMEDSSRDAGMKDDEDFQGGYGSISRAKIHDAHHDFHDTVGTPSVIAIKCLHSLSRETACREVEALERLSRQTHIVPLLAAFEYKKRYHLIFPWAQADLRRYWAMFPHPSSNRRYGLWVAKQCKGLAEGLSIIHTPPSDQSNVHAYNSALHSSHHRPQARKLFGRHGDIKPDNILFFQSESNVDIGTLKICDFGLAKFHDRKSRSNISPVGIGNSPTYRAPEFDMPGGLLSRSYDIWALGCVYLEFITWYLLGWDGLVEFQLLRETKRNDLTTDDSYFELTDSTGTGNTCSSVKPAVVRWMASLHQHWACSQFFHDFLDLIHINMLIVETNGESPTRRITSSMIEQQMVAFYNRCDLETSYLSGKNPLDTTTLSIVSRLSASGTTAIEEIQRRPFTIPGSCTEGKVLSSMAMQHRSLDPAWALSGRVTELTYPSSNGTSDSNWDSSSSIPQGVISTSVDDISSDPMSFLNNEFGLRQIDTAQTTQDSNFEHSEPSNNFACPFFKRNPRKYGKTCSRGWRPFHRLKEHIFRKHLLPRHRCTRCLSSFQDSVELEAHSRSVVPCVLRESLEADGINADQERQLRSRKRTRAQANTNEQVDDTQRWYEMYKIIFPDSDPETISPYNDYDQRASATLGSLEAITDYNKFLDRGIPSHVQIKLQATINRELGFSEVEGNKVIDILPILQRTLLESFRARSNT